MKVSYTVLSASGAKLMSVTHDHLAHEIEPYTKYLWNYWKSQKGQSGHKACAQNKCWDGMKFGPMVMGMTTTPVCPAGYVWDGVQKCVKLPPPPRPYTCPPGTKLDPTGKLCVPIPFGRQTNASAYKPPVVAGPEQRQLYNRLFDPSAGLRTGPTYNDGHAARRSPAYPRNPFVVEGVPEMFKWIDEPKRDERAIEARLHGIGRDPDDSEGRLGAVQDTAGYKACLGNLIKKCEEQYQAAIKDFDAKMIEATMNGDDALYATLLAQKNAQKVHRDTCFKQAENICVLQGTVAANTNLTPAQVTKLQNDINAYFSKMVDGPCKIGVDGNIGGETCGAAVFAVSNGATHISVPGECAKIASTYSSDGCKSGAGAGGKSFPAPACDDSKCPPGQECCKGWSWCTNNTCVNKCPEGYSRGADGYCKEITKGESKTNWGLILLALAAGGGLIAGAAGAFTPKAPKLPPREAERLMENAKKKRKKSRR